MTNGWWWEQKLAEEYISGKDICWLWPLDPKELVEFLDVFEILYEGKANHIKVRSDEWRDFEDREQRQRRNAAISRTLQAKKAARERLKAERAGRKET